MTTPSSTSSPATIGAGDREPASAEDRATGASPPEQAPTESEPLLDGRPQPRPPVAFADGTGTHNHARAPSPGRTQFERDMADLEVKFERCLDTFTMAFQPIVGATDGALFGYEALLRAGDPALPHPGAILDAAERLNRTAKLGRAIRTKVARIFGAADPACGLCFVNLHALDLLDKTLSLSFSPLAKIASRVVLEITERSSLESVDDIRFRVAELRELGFRIAIDDLGAGHARMSQFSPLDTDFVKLDMSLVRDIDSHPMKQKLIASITTLCRDQGICVIGEGVETDAEAAVLMDLGCDLLQGFLIARPGPAFPIPDWK